MIRSLSPPGSSQIQCSGSKNRYSLLSQSLLVHASIDRHYNLRLRSSDASTITDGHYATCCTGQVQRFGAPPFCDVIHHTLLVPASWTAAICFIITEVILRLSFFFPCLPCPAKSIRAARYLSPLILDLLVNNCHLLLGQLRHRVSNIWDFQCSTSPHGKALPTFCCSRRTQFYIRVHGKAVQKAQYENLPRLPSRFAGTHCCN